MGVFLGGPQAPVWSHTIAGSGGSTGMDTAMQPGKTGLCQKTEYKRLARKTTGKGKDFPCTYQKYLCLMTLEHMWWLHKILLLLTSWTE